MVDEETIKEVAENARINLGEEEIEKFREDFDDALESFDSLDDIDTEGVEPAFHPIELEERKREDSVEESFTEEETFSNTDNEEDGCFKGPRAT